MKTTSSDFNGSSDSPKRFEIFVSSTSDDLAELRRKVVAILIEKGYAAGDLDGHSHGAGMLRDLIERRLRRADALIQLVGFSTGTFRNSSETWTQYELRRASKLGLPIFPYLLSLEYVQKLGGRPTDMEIEVQSRYRSNLKKRGLLCNEVCSWEELKYRIETGAYEKDAAQWHSEAARRSKSLVTKGGRDPWSPRGRGGGGRTWIHRGKSEHTPARSGNKRPLPADQSQSTSTSIG